MLIEKDETEISGIIVALGKLMQYSMNTSDALVTMQEEYAHVYDYLMIQKVRLEDRLDFSLSIEKGLEHFLIPKLILQPLIENSIKHGIEASRRKGVIKVTTLRREGAIHITVEDNGQGLTKEQLAFYRGLLQNNEEGRDRENIGVKNVARRLQLHFSGRCAFEVKSESGNGLALSIIIPLCSEERAGGQE